MVLAREVLRSRSTVALVWCALAAWWLTLEYSAGMPPGPGAMGLGVLGFLGVWTMMMAAMMLPAVSPVVALYLRRLHTEPRSLVRGLRTSLLVAGYLTVWAAFGLVAFAGASVGAGIAEEAPRAAPWVGTAALVLAGVYQLTGVKDICLRQCRSPISFLLRYGALRGGAKDFRVGVHHGAFCVGCCWGLMLVLLVVGVMSPVWMLVIAGVILLEKNWGRGKAFSIGIGLGLFVLAAFVPAHPGLLAGLHGTPM